jgi:tyrosyl-tRNA synthetase
MKLSEDLVWRGLIKDKTFQNIGWLDEPKKFYLGIDASSDSLTIGNLAVILLARRLLEADWQAVMLVGGATSLIGDPGGKDEERDLKDKQEIAKNIKGIQSQIEKLFDGKPHELINNLDWLGDVKYLDFLRDIGKHYSMTELIQREFVNARMGEAGSGISYAEFSYSLLQGYDFWWLFTNKNVKLQIGASDQWGNMLSGVPLIRKKEGINKVTGKKFGKSEEGAIWLDAARTSPIQFYQFWMNVDDEVVDDYLKIFTLLPKNEIDEILSKHKSDPQNRFAQTKLAQEVTRLVHGEKQEIFAESVTEYITGKKPIAQAEETVMKEVREAIPNIKLHPGTSVIEVLSESGLAASNTEARRLFDSKAIYVDGQKFDKPHLESGDFKNGRLMIRRGKAFKDSALVELA